MATKKYRRVTAAVFNNEWMIVPEKLEQIVELLELKDQGVQLTEEQIAERIAAGRGYGGEPIVETSKVAVLNIFGVISQKMNYMMEISGGTSTEMFRRSFHEAINDDSVSAVLINIDSPGGSVPGVPELSREIYEARGKKRIISLVNPSCCSAAYYLGSAADEIVAIPSACDIGSIGAFAIRTESRKADEMAGVTRHVIRSTEFKAAGHPSVEMTDGERQHWESRLMQVHDMFVGDVARNRGISVETVEKNYGSGLSFLAEEALRRGMVDRIATLDEVLADLGVSTGGGASQTQTSGSHNPRPRAASIQENKSMNAKLKNALIRAGLGNVEMTDETLESHLSVFFSMQNLSRPADDDGVVAALDKFTADKYRTDVSTTSNPADTTPNPNYVTSEEVVSVIGMSHLPADTKLELQGELMGLIKSGLSRETMLERVNESVMSKNKPAKPSTVDVKTDEVQNFMTHARDAVLVSHYGQKRPKEIWSMTAQDRVEWKPQAQRHSRLASPLRLAERCLRMCGVSESRLETLTRNDIAMLMVGKDPGQLGIQMATGGPYNVSGMFNNIMTDAANVVLRSPYKEASTTYQIWMKQGRPVPDFRTVNKIMAGEIGDPQAIPEGGEFEETTITDGKETYKLHVWGSTFSITWQMIVNDSLGAFLDVPSKQQRSMDRKLNKLAYNVLKDNANMADGNPLFDASNHGNLTTGSGAPSVTTLDLLNKKMMEQSGLSGDTVLNIMPAYLIAPTALDGTVRQLLRSTADPAGDHSGVANTWEGGRIQPVIDAELSAAAGGSDTEWYLAADPDDCDTIEYAFLEGLEQPGMDQHVEFGKLGISQRIYHAFAVKALDHRGLQKHNNSGG